MKLSEQTNNEQTFQSSPPKPTSLLNLRQNLRILKQVVLLKQNTSAAVETQHQITNTHLFSHLNRIAAPSRQQHPIPTLDRYRHDLALFIRSAWAYGDDGSLWERARRRGCREEYSRCRFLRKRNVGFTDRQKVYF